MENADNKEDKQLIEAAKGGDRQAMEKLIRRYEPKVYRFGQRMCRNEADAEEVLQDTFLAMTRTLDGFRGASSVSTWLYTIARSFCIKKRRRSKYAPKHVESLETAQHGAPAALPDPAQLPDQAAESSQMQQLLNGAIEQLRPTYREVLVLRDVEGLTAPEVSEVLGITVQNVKSRLHRAREQVREAIQPLLELPTAPSSKCKQTARLFSQHLEGDIDAKTCSVMEEHVAQCPHCDTVCSSLKQTLTACREAGARDSVVPDRIQLEVRQAVTSYLVKKNYTG